MKNKVSIICNVVLSVLMIIMLWILIYQNRLIAEAETAIEYIEVEVESEPITIIEYVEVEPEKSVVMAEELFQRSAELNKIKEEGYLSNKEWFLLYKDLIHEYADYCDPPETIYDVYTEDEIFYIQRMIETEVYGGDFDSKVNVANVALNRINDDSWGDTPIEVITKPGQFAYYRTTITEETILALEYAYEIEDTTGGALYFRSDIAPATWNGKSFKFKDNVGHAFY